MVDLEILFFKYQSATLMHITFGLKSEVLLYLLYKLDFLFCSDTLIYLYPSLYFIAISSVIIMFVFLIKKLQEQLKSCFSTSKLQKKRKITLKTFQMFLRFFLSVFNFSVHGGFLSVE